MILNGKAKEDFLKQFCGLLPINEIELNAHIIEWFDSVGVIINIGNLDYQSWWNFKIKLFPKTYDNTLMFKARSEATTEAIKKANEIYNSL